MRVLLFVGVALATLSALFVATNVRAADKAASAAADSKYSRERAACESGTSANLDRATCLKEAGAAKAESRKGTLADGASPQTREVNAITRCNALPQKDRADCMARIDGPGAANQHVTTSGSVAGGGVIRETVTTTTGKAASTPR